MNTFMAIYMGKVYSLVISGNIMGSILDAPLASIGGLIGMIVGSLIMDYLYKPSKLMITKSYLLSIPILYSISKLGCFLSGCCVGIKYHGPLSVTYRGTSIVNGVDITERVIKGVALFPVQLLESMTFLIVFIIGVILVVKIKYRHALSVVLMLCAIFKGSIEMLRMEFANKMSANQLVCLLVFVVALGMIFIKQDYNINTNKVGEK